VNLCIVIPARMGASRFPGKPLADLNGKPMVQWVYERAVASAVAVQVVVATPDEAIAEATRGFGGEAVLTSADHPTGTDRIAEAAERLGAELFVNVQGDEPLIEPETIRVCADALRNGGAQVASVYDDLDEAGADDPNVVKVVLDRRGNALYFSRSPIPYPRSGGRQLRKHIGIYGYTLAALRAFASLPPGELELTESLEQLRFLENGWTIHMAKGRGTPLAVDTPEQLEHVRRIMENVTR
jgi:3-deoxy-D-manno-octulosonate cytidylyltransferase